MNCTFFGHRDVSDAIKGDLEESILSLIETERIELFLVGNNGNFDFLVQEVLAGLKREGKDVRFRIVLSRLDEKALSMNQKETVFPEELENTIPKFAISKRNEWLIKNASVLIAFVKHRPSSSAVWVERAARRGLAVRNIAKDRNAAPRTFSKKS